MDTEDTMWELVNIIESCKDTAQIFLDYDKD